MTHQDDDPSNAPAMRASRLSRVPLIGHVLTNPSLRNPDFLQLCSGTAFSNIGMSGEFVIIGILCFEITQSSAWVGIALALYHLPKLVFGLLSGIFADWMDRRTLIRRGEMAVAINLLFFSGLIFMATTQLWIILLLSVVSGSIRAMAFAARISYAYDLVGGQNVVAGLSILNLASRFGQLIGALSAGVIMHKYSAPIGILFLAAAHVVAYILQSRLRSAGLGGAVERFPIVETLRQCIVEMRTNRVLLMLIIITGAVELFGFSFSTVLPELATLRFEVGAEGLGQMRATSAVGGILATLILVTFVRSTGRGAIYLFVICAFGASIMLLAIANQYVLALVVLVVIAGLAAASDVLTQSMMQLNVPDHLRGRAMGIWMFAIGWAPIGHLEVGFLSDRFGVVLALVINGMALVCVGIFAIIAIPRLRKL